MPGLNLKTQIICLLSVWISLVFCQEVGRGRCQQNKLPTQNLMAQREKAFQPVTAGSKCSHQKISGCNGRKEETRAALGGAFQSKYPPSIWQTPSEWKSFTRMWAELTKWETCLEVRTSFPGRVQSYPSLIYKVQLEDLPWHWTDRRDQLMGLFLLHLKCSASKLAVHVGSLLSFRTGRQYHVQLVALPWARTYRQEELSVWFC